ncbi:MAG: hypothetical protein JWN46_3702 [Acidimicrobiales bacterium]|nr:hypothetical protein [Acidimicrobiales bacterium]
MPQASVPAWLAVAAGVDLEPSEPLVMSARRIGQKVWFERRLFEVFGSWVPLEADMDAKLLFGAHALHLGWRAQVWHERLPELAEMDRESFVRPASDADVAFTDALGGATSTIERLVAAYRVALPTAIAAAQAHLKRTSAVADGPLQRWIGILLYDAGQDVDAGSRVLASKLISDDDLAEAADHQERFAGLLPDDR